MLSKGSVNLRFSTLITFWSKYINSNFDNQRYLAYSMISSKIQLFLCIHICTQHGGKIAPSPMLKYRRSLYICNCAQPLRPVCVFILYTLLDTVKDNMFTRYNLLHVNACFTFWKQVLKFLGMQQLITHLIISRVAICGQCTWLSARVLAALKAKSPLCV